MQIADLNKKIDQHVVPAINGFFRSIALAGDQSLQDILRLLTLWFSHGKEAEVDIALRKGFNSISIDTWLSVIPQVRLLFSPCFVSCELCSVVRMCCPARSPACFAASLATPSVLPHVLLPNVQIIARIHTSHLPMIDDLLSKLGKAHPQALVYPLTVAFKSQSTARRNAAANILSKMREHSPKLVEQTQVRHSALVLLLPACSRVQCSASPCMFAELFFASC